MSGLFLSVLVVQLFVASAGRPCSCLEAAVGEVPHGANEYVEYKETTVRGVYGKVIFAHGGRPVGGAVVEVYAVSDAERNLKPSEIIRRQRRRAACVTGGDGSFCFHDLPSGRYVLRAGTGESAGMNEVYMKVTVARRWWTRWFRSGNAVELGLTPGT